MTTTTTTTNTDEITRCREDKRCACIYASHVFTRDVSGKSAYILCTGCLVSLCDFYLGFTRNS